MDVKMLATVEKLGGEDMDEIYRDNILRLGEKYKGKEMSSSGAFGKGDRAGFDEDDYAENGDELMKMFTRRDDALTDQAMVQRHRARAIREQRMCIQQQKNCSYCTSSKHLVVASGAVVALSLKTGPGVLVEGHCELYPLSHVSSFLQLDDDGHAEVARFKSCLMRYFETQQQSVLFLQSAVGLTSRRPHSVIDVVPLPNGSVDETKMFFREALLSADDEWTQHKRVIELSSDRPLRRAVPSKCPYVAIEWGTEGARTGLAHVVENEALISSDFCRDVVAGMLSQDPMRMRRGEVDRNEAKETAEAKHFQQKFAPYDWTQYI